MTAHLISLCRLVSSRSYRRPRRSRPSSISTVDRGSPWRLLPRQLRWSFALLSLAQRVRAQLTQERCRGCSQVQALATGRKHQRFAYCDKSSCVNLGHGSRAHHNTQEPMPRTSRSSFDSSAADSTCIPCKACSSKLLLLEAPAACTANTCSWSAACECAGRFARMLRR